MPTNTTTSQCQQKDHLCLVEVSTKLKNLDLLCGFGFGCDVFLADDFKPKRSTTDSLSKKSKKFKTYQISEGIR